jgi:transposase-like protein
MKPPCPDCGSSEVYPGHSQLKKGTPFEIPVYICKECKSIFDRKPTKKRYKRIAWFSRLTKR